MSIFKNSMNSWKEAYQRKSELKNIVDMYRVHVFTLKIKKCLEFWQAHATRNKNLRAILASASEYFGTNQSLTKKNKIFKIWKSWHNKK